MPIANIETLSISMGNSLSSLDIIDRNIIIIKLCILLRFEGIRTDSASWKDGSQESLECYLKVRRAVTIFIYIERERERGREGGKD